MTHHAYKNIFAFVAGCLLCAACHGSAHSVRHSAGTDTAMERTVEHSGTAERLDSAGAVTNGTEECSHSDSGSLRIERDSAGRPVLLLWNSGGFMRRTLAVETEATARTTGSVAARYDESAQCKTAAAEETKEQSKTYGGPLAATLALLVLGLALTARLLTPRK